MPTNLTMRSMNAAHRAALALTRGRWGWRVMGMEVLELTTTGRRTGRQHAVMLTAPVALGGAPVVVASAGGEDRPPAWFLNLRADGDVGVRLGGRPAERRRARVLTHAERAGLWPRVVAAYPHYADYQARTAREIALVVLEVPAD